MRLADIDRDTVWSLERHAGGEPEERLQRRTDIRRCRCNGTGYDSVCLLC